MFYNVGITQKAYPANNMASNVAKYCLRQGADTFTFKGINGVSEDLSSSKTLSNMEETLEEIQKLDLTPFDLENVREKDKLPVKSKEEIDDDIDRLGEGLDACLDVKNDKLLDKADNSKKVISNYKEILMGSIVSMNIIVKSKDLEEDEKIGKFGSALNIGFLASAGLREGYELAENSNLSTKAQELCQTLNNIETNYINFQKEQLLSKINK